MRISNYGLVARFTFQGFLEQSVIVTMMLAKFVLWRSIQLVTYVAMMPIFNNVIVMLSDIMIVKVPFQLFTTAFHFTNMDFGIWIHFNFDETFTKMSLKFFSVKMFWFLNAQFWSYDEVINFYQKRSNLYCNSCYCYQDNAEKSAKHHFGCLLSYDQIKTKRNEKRQNSVNILYVIEIW